MAWCHQREAERSGVADGFAMILESPENWTAMLENVDHPGVRAGREHDDAFTAHVGGQERSSMMSGSSSQD
jgi:hypothetical protein